MIPLSSDLALLNILAAASELENRGGSIGRALEGVLEKKSGDGGVVVLIDGPIKLKGCRLRPGLLSILGFLYVGVTAAGARKVPVESKVRLTPRVEGTVPKLDLGKGRCNCIPPGRGSVDGAVG